MRNIAGTLAFHLSNCCACNAKGTNWWEFSRKQATLYTVDFKGVLKLEGKYPHCFGALITLLAGYFGAAIGITVNSVKYLADSNFCAEPNHIFIGIPSVFAVFTTNL